MYINELKIYSNQLTEQADFYSDVLGLECIAQSEKQASFQIGSSVLTLLYRKEVTPYHFAINIPRNKENEALNWLKERVKILKEKNNELHDFDFWNAKAMYFYDKDRNIVEFISRKNLASDQSTPFDQRQLLCISEIGVPTSDITSKFKFLNDSTGIQKFSGGFDRFLALGDEYGLFIFINKGIKDWFPTGDTAHSSDFELHFIENSVPYHIHYQNDDIRIVGR